MRTRQAVTLLEVTIATALFGGMMMVVMESMVYMRGMAATVDDVDILEEQAGNARRAIVRDLSNSGWYYCLPGANGRRFYPQIHLSERKTWHRSEITPLPTVTIQLFNPTTRMSEATTFTASVTQNKATIFGDALVFTRLQPEGTALASRPQPPNAAVVNFDRARPLRLDQFANGRPVQGLVINPTATDQPDLTSVVWETTPEMVDTTLGPGMKAADFYDDTKVRLFCYRVVPNPVTGRGALIRYYSNPGSGDRDTSDAWVEDAVIAQDVVRMHISSFEMSTWHSGGTFTSDNEASGLTNNQIRFTIDFARNLQQIDPETAIDIDDRKNTSKTSNLEQRVSTVKTLQFTVGLRSITNALDQ